MKHTQKQNPYRGPTYTVLLPCERVYVRTYVRTYNTYVRFDVDVGLVGRVCELDVTVDHSLELRGSVLSRSKKKIEKNDWNTVNSSPVLVYMSNEKENKSETQNGKKKTYKKKTPSYEKD